MIFSVEGDVPSAFTSLGYLLGAVVRDGDNAMIRIFITKVTLYLSKIFRFELVKWLICPQTVYFLYVFRDRGG